jgi:hypothetical protein
MATVRDSRERPTSRTMKGPPLMKKEAMAENRES